MKQVKTFRNRLFAAVLAVLMMISSIVTPAQTAWAASATTIDQIDWSKAFGIYDSKKKVLDPAAAAATLEKTTTKKGKSPVTKQYKYAPGKKINITAKATRSQTVTEKLTFVIPVANRPDVTFDGDNIDTEDVIATEPTFQILQSPISMSTGKSSALTFYGAAYAGDMYGKNFQTSWSIYAKANVSINTTVSVLKPDDSRETLDFVQLSKPGGGVTLDDLEWGEGYVFTITCEITPQKK